MKIQAIILLFILFGCNMLTAQRLDDQRFVHQYTRLPLSPLEGDFKTYSVQIDQGTINLAKMGMIESSMIANHFNLESYTYQESKGDFLIAVKLDGDHYVSKEVKKGTKTEGKGDDAKVVTTYSYEVKFRIPILYQILDGKREVMVDKIYSGYDRLYTKSFGEARTVNSLEKSWENSGEATLEGWVKADFARLLQNLQRHLASEYDTRPVTETLTFYGIKKADKIGYEALNEGVQALKSTIEGATPESPLVLATFGDNINIWETALQNASADDKKESVAFQAAAYNLAQAYAIAGDNVNALATANRLTEAGRREYLLRTLLPIIEDRANRFNANQGVSNTYYSTYDAESAAVYEAAQVQQAVASSTTLETPSIEGYVVLKNGQDTLRGLIIDDYKEIKGSDGAKNFKGVYVEDQSNPDKARRYLEVEEFLYIRRNDQTLFPVRISFGPISMMTLQEPIYGTQGLVLNRLDEGDNDYSYWLVHGTENNRGNAVKKVYGLDDGMAYLNLNKFVANKFEECPTIVQKATNKEYESNGTSYRQLVDDYAACNGTVVFE
jgi:hypothetical protein